MRNLDDHELPAVSGAGIESLEAKEARQAREALQEFVSSGGTFYYDSSENILFNDVNGDGYIGVGDGGFYLDSLSPSSYASDSGGWLSSGSITVTAGWGVVGSVGVAWGDSGPMIGVGGGYGLPGVDYEPQDITSNQPFGEIDSGIGTEGIRPNDANLEAMTWTPFDWSVQDAVNSYGDSFGYIPEGYRTEVP